jgi:protein SDA1
VSEGEEAKEEEAGWNNWDAESDSSDDEEGWINVESDGEDINISDSEDEKENGPPSKKAKTGDGKKRSATAAPSRASIAPSTTTTEAEKKKSDYATTRILTPADLAKLRELQSNSAALALLPSHQRKRAEMIAKQQAQKHADDGLTADQIEGLAMLSHKQTKEEKIAGAKGDRDEKHQSTTAKRKEKKNAEGKSTTNKEKARAKNFLMTLGKAKRKGKRSLTETRRVMAGHVDRQKRGGKRGNKGS